MAFQLRDFNSVALAMINHAKATQSRLTDFNVGSVARTMLEAPAVEIDEFYQRMLSGIIDAIPVAVYHAFDFVPIAAAKATGTVTINFSEPVVNAFTIPVGTVFRSSTNKAYLSTAAVTVSTGATSAQVQVAYSEVGSAGNVGAGSITLISGFALPNVATITNSAILSGSDGETDAEQKDRFNAFILSLVRGTPTAVLYASRLAQILDSDGNLLEYVGRSGIIETPGTVDVYIYGNNVAPSSELIARTKELIDGKINPDGSYVYGYRPVGIRARVFAMSDRYIPMSLSIKMLRGYVGDQSVVSAISTSLEALFKSAPAGSVLFVSDIIAAILALTGVESVQASITSNVVCTQTEVLALGELTVTWL